MGLISHNFETEVLLQPPCQIVSAHQYGCLSEEPGINYITEWLTQNNRKAIMVVPQCAKDKSWIGDMLVLAPSVGKILDYVGLVCFGISVILTVISGISYLIKNKEVFAE